MKMNIRRLTAWVAVSLYGAAVLTIWLLELWIESLPKRGHPMPGQGYPFLFRALATWPTSWGFGVVAESLGMPNYSRVAVLVAAAIINALMLYWICFALVSIVLRIKKLLTKSST